MNIWNVIIILLAVVLGAILINTIEKIKNKNRVSMSFKETLDLCDLPIVTFMHNTQKINFLLDTGANSSVIDAEFLKKPGLKYIESDFKGGVCGMEGNFIDAYYINMHITYKEKDYEEWFQVLDMSKPFASLKQDYGVNVHGILSSAFFTKYKYILDFKDFIAYTK